MLATLVVVASAPPVRAGQAHDGGDNWLQRSWERIPHEERDVPWLVGDFNIWSGLVTAAVFAGAVDAANNSNRPTGLLDPDAPLTDVTKYGDDIYKLIPGAAYGAAAFAKDWHGLILMGLHNIASSGTMKFLKDEVGQRRPNDQSSTSFPSGHTNTAFVGAAFLQQRYGSMWGIPAYLSAGMVGWTRLHGNVHYMNDVISGASLAMISAWAIVPPYDAQRRAAWEDLDRFRPWRYEWEMTLNDVNRNTVSASGDLFEVPVDRDINEPWANSHVALEYRFDEKQSLHAIFSPWEIRTFGELPAPTDFASQTFPANVPLRFSHRIWHFGAQYRHALLQNQRFSVAAGAGLSLLDADQEIFVVDESVGNKVGQVAEAGTSAVYGVVHADAEVRLLWKLWLGAEADIGVNGDSDFSDWSTRVTLRFSPKWDTSLGWRAFESRIDDSDYFNDFRRSGPAVNVIYSF